VRRAPAIDLCDDHDVHGFGGPWPELVDERLDEALALHGPRLAELEEALRHATTRAERHELRKMLRAEKRAYHAECPGEGVLLPPYVPW
jgi:hypothetical protein